MRSAAPTACRSISRTVAVIGAAALTTLTAGEAAAIEPSPLDPTITYNYGENETPRSAAMGGALRALGSDTSAIFLNPSMMSGSRLYHIQAIGQISPEARRFLGGGALVDSVTGKLAGGVSFVGGAVDPGGVDRTILDARIALAYPIGDKFFIGLGGRYLKIVQGGDGVLGQSKVSGGLGTEDGGHSAFINTITFDVGITIRPVEGLYIAAVGQNLSYPNNGLLPTMVGGGIGYTGGGFSIEADGIADLNSWLKPVDPATGKLSPRPTARFGAGAEYSIADKVPIRVGYKFDQGAKLHTVSAGLGVVLPQFSIEASVKRTISNPGATTVVFGIAYHLESSGLTRPPAQQQDAPLQTPLQ